MLLDVLVDGEVLDVLRLFEGRQSSSEPLALQPRTFHGMLCFLLREAPSLARAHEGSAIVLPLLSPPVGLDGQVANPSFLTATLA